MKIELKVPSMGESITEVEIGGWLKKQGDPVKKDEPVVTLESEKATVDLPAPAEGVLSQVFKKPGDTAAVGEVIAQIEKDGAPQTSAKPAEPQNHPAETKEPPRIMPAAQRALVEEKLRPEQVEPTGPGGRLLKEDVLRQSAARPPAAPKADEDAASAVHLAPHSPTETNHPSSIIHHPNPGEEVARMTRLRRTVAERLVEAQNTMALLTTFNEIDLSAVVALRKEHGEDFQKKYNVKLGFMSFFVKAVIEALKLVPQLNAEIRGSDIVFHKSYDIGVAIGSGKGLVVPILRNAERLSFAEIELAIAGYARRAQEGTLGIEELHGGTFTITNGGVYGSLLSTPIVNPPQSGILGMHAIQDRPVARDGNVVIRPMMYVAVTYDHRIVDGREAVTFLKRVKEIIEEPARMLLEA